MLLRKKLVFLKVPQNAIGVLVKKKKKKTPDTRLLIKLEARPGNLRFHQFQNQDRETPH